MASGLTLALSLYLGLAASRLCVLSVPHARPTRTNLENWGRHVEGNSAVRFIESLRYRLVLSTVSTFLNQLTPFLKTYLTLFV